MIIGRTLGQCVLEIGKERLTPESEVVFAATLYLASHAGRSVPRRDLLRMFWPTMADAQARHCLRQTLYRLRRLGVPLTPVAEEVMVPREAVTFDYESLADTTTALDGAGPSMPAPYLPGYAPRLSASYLEWVEQQRDVVHARIRRVLLTAIGELRSRGRLAEAEPMARACLALDPLNEDATLTLAEATALSGGKVAAIGILDRYLAEIGPDAPELRGNATKLRSRIAERFPNTNYTTYQEPTLIGREVELAELTLLWNTCRAGAARAAILCGDAGIGKTRLATEFTRVASLQGARVERVNCQPIDVRRPLSIFVELLPRLLSLRGAAGVSPDSMRLLRRITDLDATALEPRVASAEESAALQASICRALYDLLDAITSEISLVLFADDAQHLDDSSWRVLAELHRRSTGKRFLILLTVRSDTSRALGSDARSLQAAAMNIDVGPLPSDATSKLVTWIFASRGIPVMPTARDWCVSTSAGNPYFTVELTNHALRNPGATTLPFTLRSLLGERLAALRPYTARTFQAISILGRLATVERVERLLGSPPRDLLDSLDELEGSGIAHLEDARLVPRHELLVHESLSRLSAAARQAMHTHAARLFESELDTTRSADLIWECAWHWSRAGNGPRALRHTTLCAQQLVELGEPSHAVEILQRSRNFIATLAERADLELRIARTARLVGDWTCARESLLTARRLLDESSAPRSAVDEIDLDLLEAEFRSNSDVRNVAKDALRYVHDDSRSAADRSRAACIALILCANIGDRESARTALSVMEGLLARDEVSADVLDFPRMLYHAELGDLDTAVESGARYLARAREENHAQRICRAMRYVSFTTLIAGQVQESFDRLELAYTLAEERGIWGEAWPTAQLAAQTALDLNNASLARSWFARLDSMRDKQALGTLFSGTILYLTCRLHFANRDVPALRLALPELQELESAIRLPRTRYQFAALVVSSQISLSGSPPSEDRLAMLMEGHEKFGTTGGQDFSALAIYRSLRLLRGPIAAAAFVSAYLNRSRRDRFAPHPDLLRAAEGDD